MKTIIEVLVLFFIAANVITEWVNRKTLSPFTNPMSAYLAGVKWASLQVAGFLGLALALPLVARQFGDVPSFLSLGLADLAIVVVVATKWIIYESGNAAEKAALERVHVIAAGVAFAGTNLALLMYTWNHGPRWALFAALGAPVSAALFARFAPKQTSVEEKVYAALLMFSLLILFH